MARIREKFESELLQKLQQKTNSHVSEEIVLMKAFKYFDLDNSGSVSFEEWLKAIEKIGISVIDPEKMKNVFSIYDSDGSGYLDYKEFIAGVFGEDSSAGKSISPQKGYSPAIQQQGEEALLKLREKLASRGSRGVIGLGKQFKIMDDNSSGTIDYNEFSKCIRDYRIEINETEKQALFNLIDRNRSGEIDYDELLRAARGPMNGFRKALVARAFDKLDYDNSGVIDINDIRRFYNAKAHPNVRSGKSTEDEVLGEFLETFETHHNMIGGNNREVTREEFEEYYNNISASIDNDQYFELMMNNTWKLTEAPAYTRNKAWASSQDKPPSRDGQNPGAPKPSLRSSGTSFDRFREKLAARGARGIIGIQRQFKIMDDDNSKSLTLNEFKKGCRDFKVDLDERDIEKIFESIDRDRSGFIDYDELIRAIKGPLSSFRRALVQKAWKKLDRDKSGIVDIEDLRGVYNATAHPDVKSGKKTEDDVLGEFLETFETHHNISDLARRDRKITPEEFEEYYSNVSASIDDDKYFELMMNNAWKLSGEALKQEPWAGQYSSKNFSSNSKATYVAVNHPSALGGTLTSTAPFGTSDEPVDYSTSLRPLSRPQPSSALPAGQPRWASLQERPSSSSQRSAKDLLEALRSKLASRGARGFVGLARQFKIIDDNGSKTLEYQEFSKALRDFRVDLSEESAKKLFSYFDADKNGYIDYEEFTHRLRGELNDFRKSLVKIAFAKLDKNGNGIVEIEDIKGVYNASTHPDVRTGKKTEDEILCDFLDTFESHHAIFNDDIRDHKVTIEEFLEYYSHISASIDDDRYFELMIKNAWNFEGKTYQKGWSGDNLTSAKKTR
jgi:calcyphosin